MYNEMERKQAIQYLAEKMDNSNQIVIVDRYFLSGPVNKKWNNNEMGYFEEMNLVFKNVNKILLITDRRNVKFQDEIQNFFKNKGIGFEIFYTNNLHDRLWIKDKNEYYIVGTSFNGIGFSFGFIYRLESPAIKDKIQNYLSNKISKSRLSLREKENICSYI